MSPVVRSDGLPCWAREAAGLLALSHMRARRREAAQMARERRVERPSNHLAYVAPRLSFATGDSPTFTEG